MNLFTKLGALLVSRAAGFSLGKQRCCAFYFNKKKESKLIFSTLTSSYLVPRNLYLPG